MKYRIAKGDSTYGLSVAVEILADEGWTCQGGVTFVERFSSIQFYQAMVKEK
jgi:hypothetical protein